MSLKTDWFVDSLCLRLRKEDAVLFCREFTQPLYTHGSLRNLHADGYSSCIPKCGNNKKRSSSNGTTFLSFTTESTILSDELHTKNSVKNVHCNHNEQRVRNIDVTTFGNMCVDIVLNVPTLPPASFEGKLQYMKNLIRSSPDEKFWEAGGNSNFAIAAARLGLHCVALGHIGYEKYGSFLHEVLEKEGVQVVRLQKENFQEETLLCWVLVDADHHHGFCSRFDFNKEPAFNWMKELPACAKEVIRRSKVLFCNGFLFDEITPKMITSAVDYANETGCLVFFDPGPRGKSLFKGSSDQQQALQKLISCSDVLLLTADEAEALTGLADPALSAKELLVQGCCTKWVVVKMGEKGCSLTTAHGSYQAPAFKVNVKDTVGCGDSFAAAIALGYIRGLPILNTLALANAVGAATAMGCGAGRNVAALDDVRSILLSSGASETVNLNVLGQSSSSEKLREGEDGGGTAAARLSSFHNRVKPIK